ncbi:MAG: hypothetical protein U9N61_02790 [Euryarchaeota archaeon]|nr:hypothetical protein [Euryarchaeota archaeon]
MRFVNEADTKEIQADWWDEDEKVVIKKLSYGDRQRLDAAAIGDLDANEANKGKAKVRMDLYEMQIIKLLFGIHSWTFKDQKGKDAPVSREYIHALNEKDGNFIEAAIDAYNPQNEKKD